jgi:hypothetical protein
MAVRAQCVPFQRRARDGLLPTAHASALDTALTLVREFPKFVTGPGTDDGAADCADGAAAAVSVTTRPRPPATKPQHRTGLP